MLAFVEHPQRVLTRDQLMSMKFVCVFAGGSPPVFPT
jgi:hypothetical protein